MSAPPKEPARRGRKPKPKIVEPQFDEEDQISLEEVKNAGKKVVVFHPGSHTLKIGLASDSEPICVQQIIARRTVSNPSTQKIETNPANIITFTRSVPQAEVATTTKSKKKSRHSNTIPHEVEMDEEIEELRRNAVKKIESDFKDPFKILDAKIKSKQFGNAENRALEVEEDPNNHAHFLNLDQKPKVIIGEEALRISPDEPYEIFYPFQYGHLNTIQKPLPQVISEVENIWEYALSKLNIKRSDWKDYKAVLIIPDLYDSQEIRELINMLLSSFGFQSIMVQMSSVCATFGAGTAGACVVDIGHQTTTIACVDEGSSFPHSRLGFFYGGKNVTNSIQYLLRNNKRHLYSFSKKEFPNMEMEANRLKEGFCHLRKETLADLIDSFDFRIYKPNHPTSICYANVSDVLFTSSMGLFYPDLFEPIARNDRPIKQNKTEESSTATTESMNNTTTTTTEDPSATTNNNTATTTITDASTNKNNSNGTNTADRNHAMPLDQAIFTSIKSLDRSEMRKKLFSSILLVGGTSKIDGLKERIEDRVFERLPEMSEIERVEVIEGRREMDPRFYSWKGGAIMGVLDADELWISRNEWEMIGPRLLKEKLPFVWRK